MFRTCKDHPKTANVQKMIIMTIKLPLGTHVKILMFIIHIHQSSYIHCRHSSSRDILKHFGITKPTVSKMVRSATRPVRSLFYLHGYTSKSAGQSLFFLSTLPSLGGPSSISDMPKYYIKLFENPM
jgi:hypothetical protein